MSPQKDRIDLIVEINQNGLHRTRIFTTIDSQKTAWDFYNRLIPSIKNLDKEIHKIESEGDVK